MKKTIKHILICTMFLCNFYAYNSLAQNVPYGFTYQALARNSSNLIIVNQNITVRAGIYSPTITGVLEWEETFSVNTNDLGLFSFVVGQGISTGNGVYSNFSQINWGSGNHFLKIAFDENGGTNFVVVDAIQLWSVPYAFASKVADSLIQPIRLGQLADIDTSLATVGSVLKWNGSNWFAGIDNDSDTAMFAFNSFHSNTSDTALYALNSISAVDTVLYAYNSGSANYAVNSMNAVNSINSNYCDTATYALNVLNPLNYWKLSGNSGTNPSLNFLGTTDNTDLVFKTNNIERARFKSNGRLGIGTNSPTATLHLIGNDGLVAEGTFGSGGSIPATGAGTRLMWYPKKAAFRVGGVNGTQWDDANVGNYSFASGYNNRASGQYSTVFGSGSIASGQYSIAACELSTASGYSSVAMGSVATASGAYSVALGRGTTASDSCSVAIGYHNTSTGKYALSFGYQTRASGDYSTVFGYWASANGKRGSFVFADVSSATPTLSTADNQFVARASGGVILYSNTAMTTGVTIPAGGGSWSSVSDRNKKENFQIVNNDSILFKLSKLEITSWNYKSQDKNIRHIGPMAQDFYNLFHYGESDTTITTVDIDGVSLSAIQALSKKANELAVKAKELEDMKLTVAILLKEKELLEKRILEMEAAILYLPANQISLGIEKDK